MSRIYGVEDIFYVGPIRKYIYKPSEDIYSDLSTKQEQKVSTFVNRLLVYIYRMFVVKFEKNCIHAI